MPAPATVLTPECTAWYARSCPSCRVRCACAKDPGSNPKCRLHQVRSGHGMTPLIVL